MSCGSIVRESQHDKDDRWGAWEIFDPKFWRSIETRWLCRTSELVEWRMCYRKEVRQLYVLAGMDPSVRGVFALVSCDGIVTDARTSQVGQLDVVERIRKFRRRHDSS